MRACRRPSSQGEPHLALSLTLGAGSIAHLLADLPDTRERRIDGEQAFSVATVMPALLDAWLRMLRRMQPAPDIPALAPVCVREFLYRVLQGPLKWRGIAAPTVKLGRV